MPRIVRTEAERKAAFDEINQRMEDARTNEDMAAIVRDNMAMLIDDLNDGELLMFLEWVAPLFHAIYTMRDASGADHPH